MIERDEYPRDYAHLVREALVAALPWIDDCIVLNPESDDFRTELRIEIPAVHPQIKEPLLLETGHDPEGSLAPLVDLSWSIWNEDPVLTDFDPSEHLAGVVATLERFLEEESAGFRAWFEGKVTSGGTVVPADEEPFPVGKADKIVVQSWKGTFDRELIGSWPGWPNDPTDPFYKRPASEELRT